MKRLLVLAAVAAGMASLAGIAMAGDYHVGATLVCSDCHVMHGQQRHGYTEGLAPGAPSGFFNPIGTAAPYSRLLRNDTNNLCLGCHDGQPFAPDVFGIDANSTPNGGRMAGGLNADPLRKGNDAGFVETDGHTLFSKLTPPGQQVVAGFGTWTPNSTDGLRCNDCHSVHGNANYRNMRSSTRTTNIFYNASVRYAIGTNNTASADVYESLPAEYDLANVNYNMPDPAKSYYGDWCKKCHTDFHGLPTDVNMSGKRHPTGGEPMDTEMIDRWGGATNKVKVMSPLGVWDGSDPGTGPSCFTCHKSHGNQNNFGLVFMEGHGATVTEEGDGGQMRDTCRQCHDQGDLPAGNPFVP